MYVMVLHTYTYVHLCMDVCMNEYTSTHIFLHCYSISQCTDGSNWTVPHHLLCHSMQLKLPGTITLMVLSLTVSWRRNVCNLCRLKYSYIHSSEAGCILMYALVYFGGTEGTPILFSLLGVRMASCSYICLYI